MGASCSTSNDGPEAAGKEQMQRPRRLLPKTANTTPSQRASSGVVVADSGNSKMARYARAERNPHEWDIVDALDEIINHKLSSSSSNNNSTVPSTAADYQRLREELREREGALGFEHNLASLASEKEYKVNKILQDLKHDDDQSIFSAEPKRKGYGGQLHPRFAGDHFLSNKALIDRSKILKMAQRMPKGAHLHIHFNSCLQPEVLLNIAREMDHMYITSDLPLLPDQDFHNFRRAKIQFSIIARPAATGDLFDATYADRGAMRFKEFIAEFPRHHPRADVMAWLRHKLVFREEEAHGALQTVDGAWDEFNTRTQMMKGLFNYETAYRKYTRACLHDFVRDNIQYAEIRPNFMDTNQVWTDDGTGKIDNVGIVEMIIEEYERFQAETQAYFGGLKIIYCCPRSWPNEKVAGGLAECVKFKQKWPRWIAGFDLLGEEGRGKPLSAFVPEFLQFQKDCAAAGVEIPFLFHCGETLEMGSEMDGNVLDALLLKSKRIGHGFALARHPYVMERMKRDSVCVEVCPISNEVLGLTPRMNGHVVYNLLANNVHCTVNTDNGTLFNSTLSHDFYQIMIGKQDMTLFGWKQLIVWSLQHACLSKEEYDGIHAEWNKRWEEFLDEVIAEFGTASTAPATVDA